MYITEFTVHHRSPGEGTGELISLILWWVQWQVRELAAQGTKEQLMNLKLLHANCTYPGRALENVLSFLCFILPSRSAGILSSGNSVLTTLLQVDVNSSSWLGRMLCGVGREAKRNLQISHGKIPRKCQGPWVFVGLPIQSRNDLLQPFE